jgi:RNA polymerase sigma-70 factor (ECF subfamily)
MPERTVSDDDYDRIEELMDFERFGEALAEAMSALPEEQREAVKLRVVDERSYGEVAAELGCTEPTARMRVSRGLRRIAGVLETDPSDPPIELERRRWQRRSST